MKRLFLTVLSLIMILSLFMVPSPAFARSSVDIVFIIDKSGSMDSSISGVKNNVNHFADLLSERGVSYRLGLVTYEEYVTRQALTDDVQEFKRQVSQVSTGGGTENGLDAIMNAAQNYPFDVNANKYFVLIGDENIYSINGHTDASVIQYLKSNHITLTAIGTSSIQSQFKKFTDETGGQYLDISSNYSELLTKIFEQIQRIPTLEIVSPREGDIVNGTSNTYVPSVKVTDPDSDQLEVSYFIDNRSNPENSKTVSNSTGEQIVQFNAASFASLTEGEHTMKFVVNDGTDEAQDSVRFRLDKNPPSLATPTASSTATSITVGGSATDSVAGLHSAPYRYTIGSAASSWTSASSFTKNSLTPNTSYSVKVEARDALGHTANQSLSVRTEAQLPGLTIKKSGETYIDLSFNQDSNPANTPYQIRIGNQYVGSTGALTNAVSWLTLSGKQVRISGLTPNTSYSVKAKARNAVNEETAFTTVQNTRTLASPPEDISANSNQRSIVLNWTSIASISSYDVEADGAIVSIGTANAFTHNGLNPNTEHTYRVRANNAGGIGGWSSPLTVYTLPDPPAVPSGISATPGQTEVRLSWDAVARADHYEVEIDGTIHNAGDALVYTHDGLQPKTEHAYRVRAVNAGGIGAWSEQINVKTLPYPPQTPRLLEGQPSIYEIEVSWNASDEADRYELEADGLIINMQNNRTYVHEGLKPVSGHTYRIRAVNAGGKSPWSEQLDVTTHPEQPLTPTNVMTTAGQDRITLMWYAVSYAEDYEVEIDGLRTVKVSGVQYTHEGLDPESRHTYRIRARNISGYSEWTKPVDMETFPAVEGEGQSMSLTNMAAIVTNQAITLTWETVEPNARYEMEVDGVLSDLGDNTIFHHGGLSANEFHTYKIRLNTGGEPGRWVAVLSLSTLSDPPDAPSALEGFGDNYSIELRWDEVSGATGYDLEIDGETIVDASGLDAYVHDELEPGTSHTYRLRAKNETGVTAWSPSIVRSTTSPTYVLDSALNEHFDLSLLAFNVQDFSELTFVVTYDPNQLEVADLYQYSPEAEKASGKLANSGLTVSYEPGRVSYKLQRNIVPGTSWSGEVVTLTFKSKSDGEKAVDVIVE
ncbi:VWA domain-containing protein [Paenibacillus sp. HB172176]|uniref:fibronectin type III domain-containing protein n=1 Tax=Paenibacillus sp. HB172176 TaxID=2493690 RepID=UPI00143A51C7|nr:VWA domain-containing protein [Paenibacillus sp. HB172176]